MTGLPRRDRRVSRSGLLAAVLLPASLLLAGCTDPPEEPGTSPSRATTSAGPPTTAAAHPPLADTDWTRVIDDVDCLAAGNEGIEILNTQFADVRGTGVPDAFVTLDCVHQASTWPHQVEVFDGSSSPDAPQRIAVLVSAEEKVNGRGLLTAGDLTFSGKSVTVPLAAYGADDPLCCPTQRLSRTFVWDGNRFVRQPDAAETGRT